MMPAMFLSLLKEEPLDDPYNPELDSLNPSSPLNMDMGGGGLDLPPPHAPITPTTMQPPPLIPLTPTSLANLQTVRMIRHDIHAADPGFEPISRVRSNTWPLPCPEGFNIEREDHNVEGLAIGDIRSHGPVTLLEHHIGSVPKKNTSRRNPWGNMSYADLIAQAITSSGEGRATLSQIYDWMVQNIPYFKDKGDSNSSAGWKNSIRHNLSLHNRFMRVQNEGTGKSSWWVLNPDAKPGKSTRRRANTLEGGGRFGDKKRGRTKKKLEILRNGLDATPSPSSSLTEGIDCYPDSPLGSMHGAYQLSPPDYRPRASSNASSCGRLSPIRSVDNDMHDSQVPPMSPGIGGWHGERWFNHHNHMHHNMLGPPPPLERFPEQLVDSLGDGMKIGGGPNEWPHMRPHHHSPPDCLEMPGHHPPHPPHPAHPVHPPHPPHPLHMNGFVHPHGPHHPPPPPHPPGFGGNFEEFHRFGPPHLHHGGPFPHPLNRPHPHAFPPHSMQAMSPVHQGHPNHSLSPPMGEPHFPPRPSSNNLSSVEMDMKPLTSQPFSSPNMPHHNSPPGLHLLQPPPSSKRHSPPVPPSATAAGPSSSSSSSSSSQPESNSNRSSPAQPTASSRPGPSSASTSSSNQERCQPGADSRPTNGSVSATEAATMVRASISRSTAGGSSGPSGSSSGGFGPKSSSSDFMDLDNFQGGLECNVEEVIKHELQYDEDLNFDFPHGQGHPHYPPGHPQHHIRESRESRESRADSRSSDSATHAQGNILAFPGPGGPSGVKGPYSCQSIAAGNPWVR